MYSCIASHAAALHASQTVSRYQDIVNPGSANQDPIFSNNKLVNKDVGYPGFDPLGYSKGADFETLKVKEIKNGRLAMLAFAGFAAQVRWVAALPATSLRCYVAMLRICNTPLAQAYTTGKTPLEGLGAHLANPWTTTVWQNDLARL